MTNRVSDTGVLTGIHLTIIAVLMVLAVIGIIWGSRLKRRRDVAEREEREHIEHAGLALRDNTAGEDAAQGASVDAAQAAPDHERMIGEEMSSPATASARPKPIETADEGEASTPSHATPPPALSPPLRRSEEPAAGTSASPPLAAGTAAAASISAPPASARPIADDPADLPVTQLKGLGPKAAALLASRGIMTIGQIAALNDDDAAALDAGLGSFTGRLARDRWVDQARMLVAGDRTGFEAAFGKL